MQSTPPTQARPSAPHPARRDPREPVAAPDFARACAEAAYPHVRGLPYVFDLAGKRA